MDTKQIKALMREFDESGLSKLKIKQEDFSIVFEKATTLAPTPVYAQQELSVPTPAPQVVTATSEHVSGDAILSPMVGTFYSSPSPDSADFVHVGDKIKKGQVVAILEAMKIMNELEAEFDCKVLKILASNGQAVEYDMPLFIVEKI